MINIFVGFLWPTVVNCNDVMYIYSFTTYL
jgi:hypothetical protein